MKFYRTTFHATLWLRSNEPGQDEVVLQELFFYSCEKCKNCVIDANKALELSGDTRYYWKSSSSVMVMEDEPEHAMGALLQPPTPPVVVN
jgi:hypothetical protein